MAEGNPGAAQQAGDDLVTRMVVDFATPLYRYAYRLCGCAADAEDLVQQTFVIAQAQQEQLRDRERLSAWLHAILRHSWCKQCRRERIHDAALQSLAIEQATSSPREEGVDREQLQRALDALPTEFRLVILMYFFEQLSYQEIAEQLEIPIGTVMSRLSRAKQQLRRKLETRGPALAMLPEMHESIPALPTPVA